MCKWSTERVSNGVYANMKLDDILGLVHPGITWQSHGCLCKNRGENFIYDSEILI